MNKTANITHIYGTIKSQHAGTIPGNMQQVTLKSLNPIAKWEGEVECFKRSHFHSLLKFSCKSQVRIISARQEFASALIASSCARTHCIREI